MCLTGAELLLRKINFIEDPFKETKHNYTFDAVLQSRIAYQPNLKNEVEIEEGLKGISGRAVFTTNNYGFRGDPLLMPKPMTEFRIFMVGASNVECRLLNDDATITAILQKQLQSQQGTRQVKVYNSGKRNNGTSDLLAMITHRLIHLQPNMMIVFPTSNEFLSNIRKENDQKSPEIMNTKQIIYLFMTQFQIGRYLYNVIDNIRHGTNLQHGLNAIFQPPIQRTEFFTIAAQRAKTPVSDVQLDFDTTNYVNNMLSMIGIAKIYNIPLVFVTQPTTLLSQDPMADRMHWGLLMGGVNYTAETMQKMWDRYNTATLETARKHGVPTLDLANLLPGTFDHFYDEIHFNLAGAKKSGEILADFLTRERLIPLD